VTVPLALMNGARGVVVAIVYAAPETQRVDGNEMAGAGCPSSDGVSLPRGADNCHLPDFVVVHFPDYTGLPLLPGLPRTWVPIPCIEVRSNINKAYMRTH